VAEIVNAGGRQEQQAVEDGRGGGRNKYTFKFGRYFKITKKYCILQIILAKYNRLDEFGMTHWLPTTTNKTRLRKRKGFCVIETFWNPIW
jgi:hypothetical protein